LTLIGRLEKRTFSGRRERTDLSKMIHFGKERAAFAAMHGLTCYT
jgi:hypothetical protein